MISNKATGEVILLKKTSQDTAGAYLEFETSLPPRAKGPPVHAHLYQEEEGVVQSGLLGIRIGEKKQILSEGESFRIPAGAYHTFWNAGDKLVQIVGKITPAGNFQDFISSVFNSINQSPKGRLSFFDLAYLIELYKHQYILKNPPRRITKWLFPLLIRLGRLLGKFDEERLALLEPSEKRTED